MPTPWQVVLAPSPTQSHGGTNTKLRTNARTPVTGGEPLVTGEICAPGGIRTPNLLIRSQMLYPLSYGRIIATTMGLRLGLQGYPCNADLLYTPRAQNNKFLPHLRR